MYLAQGHLLAQVVPATAPGVRALVDSGDVALVRERTVAAQVVLAGGDALRARLVAVGPQAGTALPSAALGAAGGGPVPLDSTDASGLTAREPRFTVDLALDAPARPPLGARVMVTFDHGDTNGIESLGRLLRRAFLRHLDA
jgi:hypothetical protein